MTKKKKQSKPSESDHSYEKSPWGSEEIPIEEVESVDVGDYSDMFPNLRSAGEQKKEKDKGKKNGRNNNSAMD